jgi:hypothetical protein
MACSWEMKDQGIEIIGHNYKDDPEKISGLLGLNLATPFVAISRTHPVAAAI